MKRGKDIVFEINGPLPPGLSWAGLSDAIIRYLAAAGDVTAQQELERRVA